MRGLGNLSYHQPPTDAMTMQATTGTTLVPATGLVVDNSGAAPGTPPLFCLFTEDWITMQTFIVQALQLPISTGNFQAKYGTFADEADIEGCVAAMQAVQNLSADFGDPTALIKEIATNPSILQGDTAPPQLYTHIVWFATKLYQTATTFNQTLGQFMTLLNSVPADQRQQLVTEILTGPGGLQSSAVAMGKLANDLNQALAQFNLKLAPSTTTMATYSGNATKFYTDVTNDINADISDVATYQHEADVDYKLWRDLTISATTVSIGLVILTLGMAWPLAAVAAGVLGSQAAKARSAYNAALDQVNNANADEQKKIALKTDLDAFNKQMLPVNQAAQNFSDTLAKIEGVWLQIGVDLGYIATTFTPDKVNNLPAWQEAMQLDDATQDWQTIATAASDYTQNSLVSYHILNFGDALPPDPSN